MPRRFFVDTIMYIRMCCVNQLVIKNKYFHIDILVLVSEFVVVAIFYPVHYPTRDLYLSGGYFF